jgi:hypothetical protein
MTAFWDVVLCGLTEVDKTFQTDDGGSSQTLTHISLLQ